MFVLDSEEAFIGGCAGAVSAGFSGTLVSADGAFPPAAVVIAAGTFPAVVSLILFSNTGVTSVGFDDGLLSTVSASDAFLVASTTGSLIVPTSFGADSPLVRLLSAARSGCCFVTSLPRAGMEGCVSCSFFGDTAR